MVEFLVLVVGDVLGLADQVLGVGLVSGAIAFFGQLVVVERVVVLVLIVLEIVQRKIHVLIVVVIGNALGGLTLPLLARACRPAAK